MALQTYVKSDVNIDEYILHDTIYKSDIVLIPKIFAYDAISHIMVMEKIDGMTVADYYGESDDDTPTFVYDEIRKILTNLSILNIDYIDITGYNFIIKPEEIEQNEYQSIWIIDFEHARIRKQPTTNNDFLSSFLNGHNGWNPDFK